MLGRPPGRPPGQFVRQMELCYELVQKDPGLTDRKLADRLGVNPAQVGKYLRRLTILGRIRRSTKHKHWAKSNRGHFWFCNRTIEIVKEST